jgi:hypothetical protein
MVKKILLVSKTYIASLMVACVFFGSVSNVSAGSRELKIIAGFLYNFSKFVQWPAGTFADDKSPFILCVVDQESSGLIIEKTLDGKKIKGRRIIIQSKKSINDQNSCHLVFISNLRQEGMGEVVKSHTESGVLTVNYSHKTSDSQVVINLIKYKNKFKFQINQTIAKNAGLQIGSRLLKLAAK